MAITPTGFELKRVPQIRTEAVVLWKSLFGDNADTSVESNDGLEIDFHVEATARAFEAAFGAYASAFFDSATGASLDRILALFAFPRLPNKRSTVSERLYGTATTVVPTGSIVAVDDTALQFQTTGIATIPAVGSQASFIAVCSAAADTDTWTLTLDGEATLVTYVGAKTALEAQDEMVTALAGNTKFSPPVIKLGANPAGEQVMEVTMTGVATFANGSTGSITTSASPHVDIGMESVSFGAISAEALTLRTIGTTVSGWIGAYNTLTAALGRLQETDAEFRTRWLNTSSGQGKATVDAIQGAIVAGDPTAGDVRVINNPTTVVDANGVPPHAFRAVVVAGTTATIGQIIWDTKPAGIEADGAITAAATDINGNAQTVKYSNATDLFTWQDITITKGEGFPVGDLTDIGDQIIAAVVVFGNLLGIGHDILEPEIIGVIAAEIEGIDDITILTGTSLTSTPKPPVTSGSKVVAPTEISLWAASRMTVVIS